MPGEFLCYNFEKLEMEQGRMLLRTLMNIPGRVRRAFAYSRDGLKSAFIKEESFRLEIIGLIILIAILPAVPWPGWKKAAIVAVYFLIPLTELVNSALEDLCDLVSPEFNPLIKAAKDKGSAAVLMALALNLSALTALLMV